MQSTIAVYTCSLQMQSTNAVYTVVYNAVDAPANCSAYCTAHSHCVRHAGYNPIYPPLCADSLQPSRGRNALQPTTSIRRRAPAYTAVFGTVYPAIGNRVGPTTLHSW